MADAPDRNVRNFALNLMQRYRYVIGSSLDLPTRRLSMNAQCYIGNTQTKFVMLMNENQAKAMLTSIDRADKLALICVNDDVESGENEVQSVFLEWQEKRWGRPAEWEADRQPSGQLSESA